MYKCNTCNMTFDGKQLNNTCENCGSFEVYPVKDDSELDVMYDLAIDEMEAKVFKDFPDLEDELVYNDKVDKVIENVKRIKSTIDEICNGFKAIGVD